MKTTQITYTVRAHDGLPAVRFDVEVAVIGGLPRVTLMKNGQIWCDDASVPAALESVGYLTLPRTRKKALRSKIEAAAFLGAAAASWCR